MSKKSRSSEFWPANHTNYANEKTAIRVIRVIRGPTLFRNRIYFTPSQTPPAPFRAKPGIRKYYPTYFSAMTALPSFPNSIWERAWERDSISHGGGVPRAANRA